MSNVVGLYLIHDEVAQECGPVFEAVNDAVAWRNYDYAMRETPEHVRQDYSLYLVGHLDRDTKKIEGSDFYKLEREVKDVE